MLFRLSANKCLGSCKEELVLQYLGSIFPTHWSCRASRDERGPCSNALSKVGFCIAKRLLCNCCMKATLPCKFGAGGVDIECFVCTAAHVTWL